MSSLDKDKSEFDVAGYWEDRYRSGRNSGSGSYDRLAKFKARFLNELIKDKSINSVVELGCGDGNQLSLIDYPEYKGLDISSTIIEKCKVEFSNDSTKNFFLYEPEKYNPNETRSELAVSLDVIYHLSNDEVYFKYLEHLFSSASRFVVIYSNSQSLYITGINEDAEYVRFREFEKDVDQMFPEWQLVKLEPNFYPFNPSMPEATSIADFYVYERNPKRENVVNADDLSFVTKKILNKIRVADEQNYLAFNMLNKLEKQNKLLEANLELQSILKEEKNKNKKLEADIIEKNQELSEIISGYEKKLVKVEESSKRIESSFRYQLGYHLVTAFSSWQAALKLPLALFRIAKRRFLKKKKADIGKALRADKVKIKESKATGDFQEHVFNCIQRHSSNGIMEARALIYGDVSPNILDGSSIWLISVANIISLDRNAVLLLKDNVSDDKVISGIAKGSNLIVIEPKDIGFKAPLDAAAATEALSLIYSHCPRITSVIARGIDVGYELQKRKEFSGVLYPYVTDFYEVTESGFSLVESKVEKLKEIVLNATTLLCQTNQIYQKIEEIVGYRFSAQVLPPTIPDEIKKLRSVGDCQGSTLNIGYAGKVQPGWGVEDLIDEVGKLVSSGIKISLHIATGKIRGKGETAPSFVKKIRSLLKKNFIKLHEDLSRQEALALMAGMDIVWCYRDPNLENSTLELSTKLVETAAMGKPLIAYDSVINRQFLGADYPFLISSTFGVSDIIKNFADIKDEAQKKLNVLSEKVCENYTFKALQDKMSRCLDEGEGTLLSGKKIAISGHDLKFIYPYLTHLRRLGAYVSVDPWEWGKHVSLNISRHYSGWADFIFCEWGLANAVWHSKNKKEGKKLFVRIHAQEVRKKAVKFGRAMNSDKVDKFIFVSPQILDQASRLFGWPESQSTVIPNGVKENRFFSTHREIKPVLGMVGIVPTTKRLDRALDLLALLNERGWGATLRCKGHRPEDLPFMLAPGRSQELAFYESLYKKIEDNKYLRGQVYFDGWGNDVEKWYQEVDFILSPSDNESFHYALADGVMAGCLPVVWPWSGASNVYNEDWIVHNANEAVKKIEELMGLDVSSVADMRVKNQELVSKRYCERVVLPKLDKVFLGSYQ